MKNPFRRRTTVIVNNLSPKGRERELLAQVVELQEQVEQLTDANAELADTNNRRSLRRHKQLETKDLQTPEARVSQLLVEERKLQAIARIMSGESVDPDVALLRQLGNRLGMSEPTVGRIYDRLDALQSLAPLRDQLRTHLASIDWKEDVDFDYDEDRAVIEHVLSLL